MGGQLDVGHVCGPLLQPFPPKSMKSGAPMASRGSELADLARLGTPSDEYAALVRRRVPTKHAAPLAFELAKELDDQSPWLGRAPRAFDFIERFTHRLVEDLDSGDMNAIALGLGSKLKDPADDSVIEISIGAVCSGPEHYLSGLQHLLSALRTKLGFDVQFLHSWLFEINPQKRAWIMLNWNPVALHGDITKVEVDDNSLSAYDDKSRKMVVVSPVDWVVAGFSCKDACRLNMHHSDRLEVVSDGAHSTGQTAAALMSLVAILLPSRLYMEKVGGLKDKPRPRSDGSISPSNFESLKGLSCDLGYSFAHAPFDARDMGLPVHRRRIYMEARRWDMPAGELRTDTLERDMRAKLKEILIRARRVQHTLDDFLLPDVGGLVSVYEERYRPHRLPRRRTSGPARRPRKMLRATPTQEDEGKDKNIGHDRQGDEASDTEGSEEDLPPPKWHELHAFSWSSAPHAEDKHLYLQELCSDPFFLDLAPRAQDALLLCLCQRPYPGLQDAIFNLEASADRILTKVGGVSPCLIPRGVFWLTSRGRPLLVVESMLLHGADIRHLRTLVPGRWCNRFVQDLAGNAFCTSQFIAWVVASLVSTASS